MALVLSRKLHERIVLDTPDGVRIVVAPIEVDGRRVRIAISAPRDVVVSREELLNDNERATLPNTGD